MRSNQNEHREDELKSEELIFIDQMLKESLNDEFSVDIPMHFADHVTEVIEKRKSIREALLKHLMMSLGLITILAFAVGFLFYFGKDEADTLLNFAIKFKYPIVFVLSIFTTIQLADSLLLSRTKEQLNE